MSTIFTIDFFLSPNVAKNAQKKMHLISLKLKMMSLIFLSQELPNVSSLSFPAASVLQNVTKHSSSKILIFQLSGINVFQKQPKNILLYYTILVFS